VGWRSEAQVGEDRRGPSGLTKQWYRDAVRDAPSPACLFRSQSRFRRGSFSKQTTRLLRLHSTRSLRTEPLIFGEISVMSCGFCYGFTDKTRLQSQYIRRIWLNFAETSTLRENAPQEEGPPCKAALWICVSIVAEYSPAATWPILAKPPKYPPSTALTPPSARPSWRCRKFRVGSSPAAQRD